MFIRFLGIVVGIAFLYVAIAGTFWVDFEGEVIATLLMGIAFLVYGVVGQKGLERLFPAYSEKYKKRKPKRSRSSERSPR